MSGLVLTYHAVEDGPAPLCLPARIFDHHVRALVEVEATFLTVGELAEAIRSAALPARAVAITFDDGCSSVLRHAAPVLERHGIRATVFAVAGHLGGSNDWPGQPASAPRLPLLGAGDLVTLAALGWEIGSHTVTHPVLRSLEPTAVEGELRGSRTALEAVVDGPVSSFAFPYGSVPDGSVAALADAGYRAACGSVLRRVDSRSEPMRLPRIDAHYVRKPERLRRVVERETTYLRARRVGAGARRLLTPGGTRG